MNKHPAVLYIDDEYYMLDCMAGTFEVVEMQIATASSGREGLEMLRENSGIRVVMSDYRMPGMNGIEFLETVARRHPSSVRILLSGYVDQSEIEYAITSGTVHHFIKKPWDLTRLVSLVCKALDTSESDDTEPLHPPMFMPHQTFLPA